jgi:hypothetical protein
MIEADDLDKVKKSMLGISKLAAFSTILGVVANVQVKRIPKINFLELNKYLRWTLRVPIFFLPFVLQKP